MEPTTAPTKPKPLAKPGDKGVEQEEGKVQKGKGKLGSLNNPETYENVPGHVIPILEHEFEDFEGEANLFLDGETPENEFIGFRLKQGVYGQRQPGVQMVRVKLPMGGITPEQMDAFADAVETYAPLKKGHITTRQNVQIHHVPLNQMVHMLRDMAPSGLSSREGCGNTVRNVTGDPWAGVADDEIFDPTSYASAYVRYFVRHPTTQLMPRKIKTAFTGSDADRAITGIHDIAFISRVRDGVKGFEVRVGGGTSIMARIAPTLYDFVEADNGDYLKVSEAVFRIFDRQEWLRANRARARIKVLVDKVGIDEVFEAVRRSNIDVGAQTIELNRVEYLIRGLGFVKSVEDIENSVIKTNENVPILVRHVAKVSLGPEPRRGALDKQGAEAVGGVVVARYGSNPLEVIKSVKRTIAELGPALPAKAVITDPAIPAQQIGDDACAPGAEAVDNRAAQERRQHRRQYGGDTDQARAGCAPRGGQHEPRNRQRRELVAHERDSAGAQQGPE